MPKKMVIKVEIYNEKSRSKAMEIAAVTHGVTSVSLGGDERDEVVVTGDGIDSVSLTNKLRKKLCHATLLSVQDVKPEGDGAEKKEEEDETKIEYIGYYNPHPPYPYYQVVYDPYPNNNCSIM